MLNSPIISTHMDQIIPSKEIKTRPRVAGTDKKSSHSTGRSKTGAKKLSTDPQSMAARQRRHRISNRFKTLQSLVPGAHRMDTVSMLDGAIRYVKFLKAQIRLHHQTAIFFGVLHPVSGYTIDSHHDNHYHQCYHYADMSTETISFSGSAGPSAGSFSGTMEVQPPSSPQLPEYPAPGSRVMNDEIVMYRGRTYTNYSTLI